MPGYRVHRIDTLSEPSHYRAFWQSDGRTASVERWSGEQWRRLPAAERPSDAIPTPNGWLSCVLLEVVPSPIVPAGPAESGLPSSSHAGPGTRTRNRPGSWS